jgi:hypothetical protein
LRRPSAFRLAGLLIAAPLAVIGDWSLAEFCWSIWLAGVLFTWACILTGGLQVFATASSWGSRLKRNVPVLARSSQSSATVLVVTGAACVMVAAFVAFNFLFGLYGALLSFFAEIEPYSLFGRNGFINSDFWTPVSYLATTFWAMSVGTIIAYWRDLVRANPWKKIMLPLATEVARVHLMVVVMPFITLAAWAVVGESYQPLVIVLLMVAFYLLPTRTKGVSSSPASERVPA